MPQLLEDTSPSEPCVQLSLHTAPSLTPNGLELIRRSDAHSTMAGLVLMTFSVQYFQIR